MGDRQAGRRRGDEPRRAAARAAPAARLRRKLGEAVAAEARHGGGAGGRSRHVRAAAGERVAGATTSAGSSPARGEGEQQRLVGGDIVEHGGEKARVGRRLAQIVRAEAGQREEPLEPLGIGGEKAQARRSRVRRRALRAVMACR